MSKQKPSTAMPLTAKSTQAEREAANRTHQQLGPVVSLLKRFGPLEGAGIARETAARARVGCQPALKTLPSISAAKMAAAGAASCEALGMRCRKASRDRLLAGWRKRPDS
jgi:hypothetical protein